jgi:P4 family phage/plasmid primase-like protien
MSLINRKDLFASKMIELYGSMADTVNEIAVNKEMYKDEQLFHHQRELIRIHDMYTEYKEKDVDVGEALWATCLWYCHVYISTPKYNYLTEPDEKGRQKLDFNEIARSLIERYCIISANNVAYIYINSMYYEDKNRLAKDIVKILKNENFSDHTRIKPIVEDIVYRIKTESKKFDYPFNKKAKEMIPVINGVVVRKSLNILLPKSPVWGFTYSLPVKYDKHAPKKKVLEFIKSVVSEEDQDMLIQIPAQALMQDENYQLSYLLTGGGSNGKSTFLTFITKLVGKENTTAISLQGLIEDKFKAAELQGKLLNIYADLPSTSVKTTGGFKILTGGDSIAVERKYGDPFVMVNKAVFIFSANELPQVDDGTFAFWRRWAVIDFPNKFAVDTDFVKQLMTDENLSGFLNLVIDRMGEISKNSVKRSTKVEKIMEAWKSRSNSAYAFVKNKLLRDNNTYVSQTGLFNEYTRYCEEFDMTPVSKIKFTSEVEKFGGIISLKTVHLGDQNTQGQRIRVFNGVKMKPTDTPFAPTIDPNTEPSDLKSIDTSQ